MRFGRVQHPTRYFLALWPSAAERTQIMALTAGIPRRDGRRVPLENLHLTLVFLGRINADALQAILTAAAAVTVSPFQLHFDTAGYWPDVRAAWLGCSAVPESLWRLQAALHAAARVRDVHVDARPYVPHVTLLRDARAGVAAPATAITWQVGTVSLIESAVGPAGARYVPVASWPLSGLA